jgi:hypothetical protein
MEDEAGPGFGFTSFDTFMNSRLRYRYFMRIFPFDEDI